MEKIDLTSADYWTSPGIDVRFNPRRSYNTDGLREAASDLAELDSAIVLATSGSEGQVKYVVLAKSALLASARAVNAHCGIGADDVWLAGLSTFHVGGLGIYARAFLTGSPVIAMRWDDWQKDGSLFVKACDEGQVTVTSLTPVHLFDLVEHRVKCPPTLRGVFIGGGALSEELATRARELGWPLWTTYGMTESASQIATSLELTPILPILPIWETATDKDSKRLKIRGPALFTGYLSNSSTEFDSVDARSSADGLQIHPTWSFDPARDSEGWFTTGDCVELINDHLKFKSRADDLVKVLGELVSVSKLEKQLCSRGLKAVVIPKPHPRRGHELFAFVEGGDEELEKTKRFNKEQSELEKLTELISIKNFPTTEIGKIDRISLIEAVGNDQLSGLELDFPRNQSGARSIYCSDLGEN